MRDTSIRFLLHRATAVLTATAMLGLGLASTSQADAAPPSPPPACKAPCGASEVCSPQGTCVSKCNPGCAVGELCSPDGVCVSGCNPMCPLNETCSPDFACVSKCNPACADGGTCRADGTCYVAPAPAAPRTVIVDPRTVDEDDTHPSWALFGVGTGLFVVSWVGTGIGVTAVCGDLHCDDGTEAVAFIPLGGPIAVLAMGDTEGASLAALIAAEALQVTGLTTAILGLVLQVPSSDARADGRRFAGLPFQLTPLAGPGLVGVGAHGSF